jgi:hypothetical protein
MQRLKFIKMICALMLFCFTMLRIKALSCFNVFLAAPPNTYEAVLLHGADQYHQLVQRKRLNLINGGFELISKSPFLYDSCGIIKAVVKRSCFSL